MNSEVVKIWIKHLSIVGTECFIGSSESLWEYFRNTVDSCEEPDTNREYHSKEDQTAYIEEVYDCPNRTRDMAFYSE